MNESRNQEKVERQTTIGKSGGEGKNTINWWVAIISVIAIGYLSFSLISPMFLQEEKLPRKIETPDLVLIALILFFNSGLVSRLENVGISKDGGFTATFKELKQEVNQQKKQIDELQERQLEQLKNQQRNLEEMQAFMYNFLLAEKDVEKIYRLEKHSEAKTNYKFYVSDKVGDELRRLRDWKLIATKSGSGYIAEIVRASDYGKREIDLTKYLYVTGLGKNFLRIREALKSKTNPETKIS
ncbi:MAG: SlyX family protein [Oscillatoria sp. SIO1A7]|nr:SlyX family protein [Oscillatoria sp. SIO1A7]